MIFGKSKARTAEEILKDIEELPDEEREKLRSALNGAEAAPDPETGEQPASPPVSGESETEGPAPETVDEPAPETAEEPAETPEQEPEPAQAEETEQAPAAEPEAEAKVDYAEAIAALVSRMDAMESALSGLQNAKAEAEEKQKDQDFGMNPSAPQKGEEDSERMSAVIRGYAGRNAKEYI